MYEKWNKEVTGMSIGNGTVESVEKGEDSCLRRWEQLEKRVMCDKKKGFCKNKRKDVHGGG